MFRFAKHEPSRLGGIHVRFRFAKFEAGRLVPPIISRALFCLYRVVEDSRQWSSHGVIRLAHSIVSGGSSGRAPKWSISALNDGRDPLFSTIFSRTCDRSSIDLVQKCSVIFLMTNDGQDLGPIGASRSPVFDLENGSMPASSPKKWVRIRPINSLKKLFKEHLRHTHSFALFRNCACGAIRSQFTESR